MKELAGNVSQRTDILNCVLKGREMHFRDLEYYIVGHLVVVVVGGGRGDAQRSKRLHSRGCSFTCKIDLKLILIIEDTEKEKKNPK